MAEQECASGNGSVCCIQQGSYVETCVQLVPTSKYSSYVQPLNQGIIYCMKWEYRRHLVHFFSWEIDRDVPTQDTRKWNILDAMRGAMAWESIMPAVLHNHFANAASVLQVQRIPTVMKKAANGWNCRATMIVLVLSKNFWMLTNLSQQLLISWHFGQLWPKLKACGRRGRGKHGENLAPLHLTSHKDALMSLSLLDSVLSSSEADDKIVKSMDKLQNFVPKVYKNGLKQSIIDSYC
jgi:hypothetical protein